MKQMMVFPLLMMLAGAAGAQTPATTPPPPKLRMTAGVFSYKYEIGEKDATGKSVRLHLEKYNAQAYHQWRRAEGADTWALVFGVLALGGSVVGLAASDDVTRAGGLVVGSAGLVGMFSFNLVSAARREKAVRTYNTAFGY